jgi:hypothetical protein
MAARPWRTGWSVERGVDFSLAAPAAPIPVTTADPAPGERACFIDEDWTVPPGAEAGRAVVGLAAAATMVEEPPETVRVRAWWSLARKSSQTR